MTNGIHHDKDRNTKSQRNPIDFPATTALAVPINTKTNVPGSSAKYLFI